MMDTITYQGALTVEDCPACYVIFAMPQALQKARRQDGKSFYCPNGHSMSYTDPENARLRKQVERLRAQKVHLEDQRLAAERVAAAYKGQVTKIRNRVGNGVCPCCNRNFQNLQRHMNTKHPDYKDGE